MEKPTALVKFSFVHVALIYEMAAQNTDFNQTLIENNIVEVLTSFMVFATSRGAIFEGREIAVVHGGIPFLEMISRRAHGLSWLTDAVSAGVVRVILFCFISEDVDNTLHPNGLLLLRAISRYMFLHSVMKSFSACTVGTSNMECRLSGTDLKEWTSFDRDRKLLLLRFHEYDNIERNRLAKSCKSV